MLKKLRFASNVGGHGKVLRYLKDNGIKCSQSLLVVYEKGKIGNPDPAILRQLASLYGVSFEGLIALLIREKYGVDFTEGKAAPDIEIQQLEKKLAAISIEISKLKKRR